MTLVFARIILRYMSGALIAAGYLDPELGTVLGADPDVLMVLGLGLGVFVEFAYAVAKRMGYRT